LCSGGPAGKARRARRTRGARRVATHLHRLVGTGRAVATRRILRVLDPCIDVAEVILALDALNVPPPASVACDLWRWNGHARGQSVSLWVNNGDDNADGKDLTWAATHISCKGGFAHAVMPSQCTCTPNRRCSSGDSPFARPEWTQEDKMSTAVRNMRRISAIRVPVRVAGGQGA